MSGPLNPADLARLRDQHPHALSVYMSVMIPEILYVGTVDLANSSYAYLKTNTISGNLSDLEPGQTLYIGAAPGDDSHGRRRFRYLAGDADDLLFIDENGMDWVNGWVVTAYKNWQLWPRFPFISSILNDDGSTNFLFYKDFNIPYRNQNNMMTPVAIAGTHQAGWLVAGSAVFTLDASDSYAMTPGAAVASYLWECDSGIIGAAGVANTTITFAATGIYWVKLSVADDNGDWQSTYRAIFVHDSTDMPYVDFSFRSPMTGSWQSGGWDIQLEVRGEATVDEFPAGALVVLWTDQYYGTEEVSVGDNRNILFAGYIGEESVSKEIDTGYVNFSAATINALMDRISMNSVSITAVDPGITPSDWNHFRNELTIARAVHHYFKWHSTLFEICDVFLPIANTSKMVAQDFGEGTLYNIADTFALEHGIFAHLCCTKDGILHLAIDIQMLNDTDRALIDTVMEITEEDRKGEVDIELFRSTEFRTHYATVTGVSGEGKPFGAQSLSSLYEVRGTHMVSFERCVIDNQAHALELCGRVFGLANLETIEIRIPMAGNYSGVMPLVPQEWFTISLAAGDTKRGIVWVNKKVSVREVRLEIDQTTGVLVQEIICEPEADTYPSEILLISGGEPYNIPLPPFPILPAWAFNFPTPPFPFDTYMGEPVRNINKEFWSGHTLENAASAIRINDDNLLVVDATHVSMGYNGYKGVLYDGYYFYFTVTEGVIGLGQGQLWRVEPDGTTLRIEIADGTNLDSVVQSPVLVAPGVIAYIWQHNTGSEYEWEVRLMDFNVAEDETGISTVLSFDEIEEAGHYNYLLNMAGGTYNNFDYLIIAYQPIRQAGITNHFEDIVFKIYNYQVDETLTIVVDTVDINMPAVNQVIISEAVTFEDKIVYFVSIYNSGTSPIASQNYAHVIDLTTLTISSTELDAYLAQEGYNYRLVPDFANSRVYFVNKDEDTPDTGAARCYFALATESVTEIGGDVDTDWLASRVMVYYKVDGATVVFRNSGGNVDIGEDEFIKGICRQVDEVEARIWVLDTVGELLTGYSVGGVVRDIDVSGTDLFPLPVALANMSIYVNVIGDKIIITYRDHTNSDTYFYIVQGS